jgi:hypothetical protein
LNGASQRSKKIETNEMRNRTRRRLEVLERRGRTRKFHRQSISKTISFLHWKIVLAYHVGGLRPDEEDPGEAHARALGYESRLDYLEALSNANESEIDNRFKNAARRLFAQVDLDLDRCPSRALSDSFIRIVNQLPEQWLRWLEFNLLEACRVAPISGGFDLPLEFKYLQQESHTGTGLER